MKSNVVAVENPLLSRSEAVLPSSKMKKFFGIAGTIGACLILANCSSSVDPNLGVKASPRVVSEGEPVPKGGGRNQVGKPYKVGNRTYVPKEEPGYKVEGVASWYGTNFHGRMTSNGEVFDSEALSAAHPTMPLPSYAKVTNLDNGRSIVVRVNDRGPFHSERVVDVSRKTAEMLGFRRIGKANVRLEYVGRASLTGSDDQKLLATYDAGSQPNKPAAVPSVMTAGLTSTLPPEASVPDAATAGSGNAQAFSAPMPPSAAPTPAEALMAPPAKVSGGSGGPYIPYPPVGMTSQQPAEVQAPQVVRVESPAPVLSDAPPDAAPAPTEVGAMQETAASDPSQVRPSPASRIASAIPVTLEPIPLMNPALMSSNRQQFVAPSLDSNTLKSQ